MTAEEIIAEVNEFVGTGLHVRLADEQTAGHVSLVIGHPTPLCIVDEEGRNSPDRETALWEYDEFRESLGYPPETQMLRSGFEVPLDITKDQLRAKVMMIAGTMLNLYARRLWKGVA